MGYRGATRCRLGHQLSLPAPCMALIRHWKLIRPCYLGAQLFVGSRGMGETGQGKEAFCCNNQGLN